MNQTTVNTDTDTNGKIQNYELMDFKQNRLSEKNKKLKPQSTESCARSPTLYELRESNRSSLTIGDSQVKKTNLNPFLSEPGGARCSIKSESAGCPIKPDSIDNGKSPTTPFNSGGSIATEDGCYACDACTQTNIKKRKTFCSLM